MATVAELAKRCGKSETAIRQWCKRNKVSKDGKTYIINESIESAILAYYHIEVLKEGFECSEHSEDATQLSKDAEGAEELVSEVMNVSKDSELAELRASNVALTDQVEQLKEEVASMTYQIETATFERDALNDEINRLNTANAAQKDEIERLRTENRQYAQKVMEYADQFAKLTDQAQKLQAMAVQTRPKWQLPWHRRDGNDNQG